ncbi:Protein of unknown function (DUF3054) [Halovivax ruber XH-70]|uniref:DUF3054 domain-containing protein n=1 Tax=Halovivax ruber (strain DSM 18193 / JCM 13892 / XH-70) TaxID=797302 RepID=L0ID37_HALRX|nr:DUF3054 domain-containing protein [Halovivax ruber]AGB17465.1 Protein of unknown function (DUF3054) [Halovivax ruber XH-70]
MSESHAHVRRLARTVPRSPVLPVLDLVVITTFIGYGLTRHGLDPWAFPTYTVKAVTPFAIGWLLVAPLLGAYSERTLGSFAWTAGVVAGAWVVASLLGGAIRATSLFPGGATPIFMVVIVGFGLAFVLAWRLVVTAVHRRWRGQPRSPAGRRAD